MRNWGRKRNLDRRRRTNELRESLPNKATRAPSLWLRPSQPPFILNEAGVRHRWPLLSTGNTIKRCALRGEPSNSATGGGRGLRRAGCNLGPQLLTWRTGSSFLQWAGLHKHGTQEWTADTLWAHYETVSDREHRKSPLKASSREAPGSGDRHQRRDGDPKLRTHKQRFPCCFPHWRGWGE